MGRASEPRLLSAVLAAIAITFSASSLSSAPRRISHAADLPRLYFRGPENADDMATSAEAFAPLAAAVRAHIERVLRDYEIQDRTTLKNLHTTLAHLALLEGKDDEVLDEVKV